MREKLPSMHPSIFNPPGHTYMLISEIVTHRNTILFNYGRMKVDYHRQALLGPKA